MLQCNCCNMLQHVATVVVMVVMVRSKCCEAMGIGQPKSPWPLGSNMQWHTVARLQPDFSQFGRCVMETLSDTVPGDMSFSGLLRPSTRKYQVKPEAT